MWMTTLNKIQSQSLCVDGFHKLLKHLGKTEADDDPLSIIEILDSNGLDDALWCLRAVDGNDREIRLLAVEFARDVKHLMRDPSSIEAVDVAERYANGLATDEQLAAALAAARSAAAARDSARAAAAWAAARAAAAAAWATRAADGDAALAADGAATAARAAAARTAAEAAAARAAAWAAARDAALAADGAAAADPATWAAAADPAAWAAKATKLREMAA